MKKLLTAIFILITIALYSANNDVKVIREFWGHDCYGMQKKIQLVEFDIYKGFKVDNVYFLAEKYKYDLTVKSFKNNYLWHVFSGKYGEMLLSEKPIWCTSTIDFQTNEITFIYNLFLYADMGINTYYIEFNKNNLR